MLPLNLTSPQKSLLPKGPSFVNIKHLNWCELRKDFTKLLNQLRPYKAHTNPDSPAKIALPSPTPKQSKCFSIKNPQIIRALNYLLMI